MKTNSNSYNTVKPSEILPLARLTFATGRFLFIAGSGGAGKTSIACGPVAQALGLDVWFANLSGMGPQEVIGYGLPQPDGNMRFAAPSIWPTYDRVGDKPVLLVLDEFPDWDPAVRALCRSLFPSSGAKHIGPHRLGTNVNVIVTGNRRSDGSKSSAVEDAPFTERCVKCTLVPDLSDWLSWYDSMPTLAACGSHVPAFLSFGSTSGDGRDHFNPPIPSPYLGEPHACPRTWEAVALAEPARKTEPQAYKQLVRGSVGEHTAAAFFGFLQLVDQLPDISALKKDPESFDVPAAPDKQFALVSACLATATRGIADVGAALHAGKLDWLVSLLLRCRGDIREFGARSAVRRGIPLDEHRRAIDLIVG